jgi:putative ABC transport system permease protein
VHGVGDTVEIRGHRARIVGLTHGIRTFTTAPTVFTSFKNAVDFMGMKPGQTRCVLVRAAEGVDPGDLARRLDGRLSGAQAFSQRIGSARRSLTGCSARAPASRCSSPPVSACSSGSSSSRRRFTPRLSITSRNTARSRQLARPTDIYRVITQQAMASAVVGYGVGIAIAIAVSQASQLGTTAILLPWPLLVALGLATAAMCLIASIVSINKATKIDPAMVFRN